MSASLKVHSTVLAQVRQANPREDLRRQRVFAWAVTAVILTGSVSLGRWTSVIVSPARAASTWRRLWRFLNNPHLDVASYCAPFIRHALAGWRGCHVLLAIDHSFRDDKSGALGWEDSHLDSVQQVERMSLVMAVAVLYLVSEGTFLVNAGRRAEIDPHRRRGLSYLQLGLRAFHQALTASRRIKLQLRLDPRPDPDPVCPYGIPFPVFGRFTWRPSSARPAGV